MEIKNCRVCYSEELMPVVSLGNHHISNFIELEEEQGEKMPLELVLCKNCKLLQLKHNAPSGLMWGDKYWYKSGINRLIREDLLDSVRNAERLVQLDREDIVVDIGCNDGTMLGFYNKDQKPTLVGFEPSKNVAKEAESKGHKVINNFFNAKNFKDEFEERKAKIITSISMFYDLDDPNKFLEDITSILHKDGLFIIQQNYLNSMLRQNAFDNICHEHRTYYSLKVLEYLLGRHNLEIFDVLLNNINGGSIRTYIKFKDSRFPFFSEESKRRLWTVKEDENTMRLEEEKPYQNFAERIDKTKRELLEFLIREKGKGKTICGCGASTRGNTLLQYFGLNPDLITCIFDRNPDKEGKKTTGTLIPVTSPDNIWKYNPDYQLVLIWHIFNGIGDDEKEFLKRGGKFILPLPEFKMIDNQDWFS